MTSHDRYPEFKYIKISELWKNCLLSVWSWRSDSSVGAEGVSLYLSLLTQTDFLFLSCYCTQSDHRTVYLDNKATIFYKILDILLLYQYVPINECYLLTESSFCFRVTHTKATFLQRITPTAWRSSGWVVSFPICKSFKHSVGWKRIWRRYQDKTRVRVLW